MRPPKWQTKYFTRQLTASPPSTGSILRRPSSSSTSLLLVPRYSRKRISPGVGWSTPNGAAASRPVADSTPSVPSHPSREGYFAEPAPNRKTKRGHSSSARSATDLPQDRSNLQAVKSSRFPKPWRKTDGLVNSSTAQRPSTV